MKTWVQRLLLPLGNNLSPQKWIFVLGSYNSGTTLLANILRQHPNIEGLRTEGVYLTDSLPYPEMFGWPRMWWQCFEDVRIPVRGGSDRAKRIKRQWSIWFPRGAKNLVEKSVANAARIPFFEAYFQPAYFIYIIRNGYAVAAGIREKANLKRWRKACTEARFSIDMCAYQWLKTEELVFADSVAVQRFLPIYYENLVSKPIETIKSVTEFLALETMPDWVMDRTWNIHGSKSLIRDMNSDSLARLSTADVDTIESVAGERLRWHGYGRPSIGTYGC